MTDYMSSEVVCFDKDGTLADNSHRIWLAKKVLAGEATWDEYSRACTEDKPIEAARELMHLLAPRYPLYVMTASQKCPEALVWLRKHRFPFSHVMFRPDDDHTTPDGKLKVRWIKELQSRGIRVRLFVENFVEGAEMIEYETGVPCLVITPRYEEHSISGSCND